MCSSYSDCWVSEGPQNLMLPWGRTNSRSHNRYTIGVNIRSSRSYRNLWSAKETQNFGLFRGYPMRELRYGGTRGETIITRKPPVDEFSPPPNQLVLNLDNWCSPLSTYLPPRNSHRLGNSRSSPVDLLDQVKQATIRFS